MNHGRTGLSDLDGAWRLALSLDRDGVTPTGERAIRLIAGDCWAEVRVPAARPSLVGRDALDRCDVADLLRLGDQRGGSGRLRRQADTFMRTRDFSFSTDLPGEIDTSLTRNADLLIERGLAGTSGGTGPDGALREDWRLEPGAAGARGAYALEERAEGVGVVRRGSFVLVGDHLLLVRERLVMLTGSKTWGERLAQASGDVGRLAALLDFEVTHARRQGPGALWQITLSTLPFRETTLFAGEIAAAATRGDATLVERMLVDGREVERRWTRRSPLGS